MGDTILARQGERNAASGTAGVYTGEASWGRPHGVLATRKAPLSVAGRPCPGIGARAAPPPPAPLARARCVLVVPASSLPPYPCLSPIYSLSHLKCENAPRWKASGALCRGNGAARSRLHPDGRWPTHGARETRLARQIIVAYAARQPRRRASAAARRQPRLQTLQTQTLQTAQAHSGAQPPSRAALP